MKQSEKLDKLGKRILEAARTELTLAMPHLASPLNSLSYVMDLTTTRVGTDAVSIRFNPGYLFRLYTQEAARLNRTYLHMLIHCLFGHMFSAPRYSDQDLWNLCCDIAVESVIDDMDNAAAYRITSDFRQQVYEDLQTAIGVLTAEKLYAWFSSPDVLSQFCDRDVLEKMEREFLEDDHSFWERMRDEDGQPQMPDMPMPERSLPLGQLRLLQDHWQREGQRVQSELNLLSKEASKENGVFLQVLSWQYEARTDYRQWLQKLSVLREEARPDPEHFDMGLYHYGLSLYGNMPLIEELELRETRKIDELVIAIDTSASCMRDRLQQFLNETASLLKRQETFFHRVDVRIIQCDDQIQEELRLADVSEMEAYAGGMTLKGGYGTDFRPVFSYVSQLRAKGELQHLRGLLYFTDGYGSYPKDAPVYETAFVFDTASDYNDRDVPGWAVKLYMLKESQHDHS